MGLLGVQGSAGPETSMSTECAVLNEDLKVFDMLRKVPKFVAFPLALRADWRQFVSDRAVLSEQLEIIRVHQSGAHV